MLVLSSIFIFMNISEKELKEKFYTEGLEKLQSIMDLNDKIRLYAFEFPIQETISSPIIGYADIVLEVMCSNNAGQRPLIVVEAKKEHITHSALDQLNFYVQHIKKKLYRKKVIGMLMGPSFSKYEIQEAINQNVFVLQIDENLNMRILEEA